MSWVLLIFFSETELLESWGKLFSKDNHHILSFYNVTLIDLQQEAEGLCHLPVL